MFVLLKELLPMDEHCHCGYEVEFSRDWSDTYPGRQYVACPLFEDDMTLGCTYFRWVEPEGTECQRAIIVRLHKDNEELRKEINNLKREALDKARRSEETKRILNKFKKES